MRYIKIFELYNKEQKGDDLAIQLKVDVKKYKTLKDFLFKNNGLTYLELFTFFIKKVKLEPLIKLYNDIFKYNNLLKERGIYPLTYLDLEKDPFKQYELLSDTIFKYIKENDKRKFAFSFISNKYKYLLNDNIINLLYELKDNMNREQIQTKLFKKLVLIKNSTELEEKIKTLLNEDKTWNIDFYIKLINKANARILHKDNNIILVDVQEDYKTLCKIVCYKQQKNTHNWCIVRENETFNDYIADFRKILVLFDFSYEKSDGKSCIGIQVSPVNNKIESAYDAYDDSVEDVVLNNLPLKEYIVGYDEDYIIYKLEHLYNNISLDDCGEYGLVNKLKELLNNGDDPTKTDIMEEAVEKGHVEIIRTLLQDKRVDPSEDDNYILQYAINNNRIEIIKLLLQDKRVVDKLSKKDYLKYKKL